MVVEIPYEPNSLKLFEKIAYDPWAILLDSCHHAYRSQSRFDIIAAAPAISLQTLNVITSIHSKKGITTTTECPLEVLKKYLPNISTPKNLLDLPFVGGAIGYWSYDLARSLEKIPSIGINDCDLPEMAVGIYDS